MQRPRPWSAIFSSSISILRILRFTELRLRFSLANTCSRTRTFVPVRLPAPRLTRVPLFFLLRLLFPRRSSLQRVFVHRFVLVLRRTLLLSRSLLSHSTKFICLLLPHLYLSNARGASLSSHLSSSFTYASLSARPCSIFLFTIDPALSSVLLVTPCGWRIRVFVRGRPPLRPFQHPEPSNLSASYPPLQTEPLSSFSPPFHVLRSFSGAQAPLVAISASLCCNIHTQHRKPLARRSNNLRTSLRVRYDGVSGRER